jgi:DNA polymerase-1
MRKINKHQLSPEAAYNLLHEGSLALAAVEETGVRIDVKYLKKARKKVATKITKLERRLRDDDVYAIWRKRYGSKTSLTSRPQLGEVIFNIMGYECKERTAKTGRPKTDGAAFDHVDLPFVKRLLKIEKLRKVDGTFLAGIEREVVGERLHPVFNVHLARSMRSSSDSPNFQNFPIRDPIQGELVRRCFIARDDYHLVEIDYSGVEVHAATWYHGDKRMHNYLADPTTDMHRDMAAQCYKLEEDEVTKPIRHCGKNMFVFPQFYGDYYIHCAKQMWEAAETLTVGETPLRDVMASRGIRGLGDCDPKEKPLPRTFERHLQKVEKDFWGNRFAEYGQWKDDWWTKYLRQGGFPTLSGFIYRGLFNRKEAINYPIQGTAFHCLLWSLTVLERELRERGMKTRIVGQIHDSIIAEVHKDELDDYLELANEIMCKRLPETWRFIDTQLEIEAEVVPLGETWHDKKEVTIPSGASAS